MERFITSRVVQSLAQRARIARAIVTGAFAVLFIAACSSSTDFSPISSLTIAPTSATLATGGTQQFTVVTKDGNGNTVTGTTPTWSVVAGGGTITQTGLFTAGTTAGTFTNTVAVTCSGITVFATVIVSPGALATITVTPNPGTMPINTSLQYTAVGRDANNNIVAITPVWSVTAGGGTINASTGLFTAGAVTGTFTNTVRATSGTIFGTATAIVTAGPLASIVVTPNPGTMQVNTSLTYTASGRDAGGNTVPIPGTVSWTVVNGGGTVPVGATGLTVSFTAGNVAGTFNNTVQASNGTLSGTATAIVTAGPPPPPPPASGGFTILGRAAVTCSTGSIIGDIGTFQAAGDAPPGSITAACGPVTTGTVHAPGDPASKAAYNNFLNAYIALAPVAGDCNAGNTLTGTLAGISLTPGTYCFTAAAALTGTLTLNGPPTGVWLFKIGTAGTGDLTGTNFNVVMAGGAVPCNVTWWVRQASAMSTSNFKGIVMAGTGVTFTGGTFIGNGWAGASGSGDATETGSAITGCP
jgi:hypothetical protein